MRSYKYIILLVFIIFSGCATPGYYRAQHNGKYYYFPTNCERYIYSKNNPDLLHCLTDGRQNGTVLRPATQEELYAYHQQQVANQIAYQNLMLSLQNTSNNINRRNMQMQQSINSLSATNQALINQQRQREYEYNQRMQQLNYNMQMNRLNNSLEGINNTLRGY
ncbi:hypothetical protein [Campylobacter corcagiensis]|uniref:Lipoprotein n=1 Tax=Campylobacter corcagiensis TaxID=1448857 RepID=A0A7M1LDT9_9BACT|nr:hypothetical protein [Campylobacter corcagiensis]QKF65119.1 hypothetical protein CCORG_1270 [Campylobacter corcagiensis]QOQ86737.1 hypothetical protein IMC76_05810 [Campylobacter corcagiensis]